MMFVFHRTDNDKDDDDNSNNSTSIHSDTSVHLTSTWHTLNDNRDCRHEMTSEIMMLALAGL